MRNIQPVTCQNETFIPHILFFPDRPEPRYDFHPLGCSCNALVHEPGKLDPRSEEGTLLGYVGSCGRGGARIRLKSDNLVIITGNVRYTPLPEPGAPEGELACLTAAPRAHEPAYVFDDVLVRVDDYRYKRDCWSAPFLDQSDPIMRLADCVMHGCMELDLCTSSHLWTLGYNTNVETHTRLSTICSAV